MSRPIFVGNFEYETRQSELERLFSKYGRIERVDMKSGTRSSNVFCSWSYGYTCFPDNCPIDIVAHCINLIMLIELQLMESELFLGSPTTLQITLIAMETFLPASLLHFHSQMASSCILFTQSSVTHPPHRQSLTFHKNCRGFAFVYFEDDRDAADAIRGLDNIPFGYDRRRLSVEWARGERGRHRDGSKSMANQRPTKTLFVINFDPIRTRERDIKRHFEPYGNVLHVRIRRNFAFVQFETQEEATKALESTDRSKLVDRVISVEYALKDDSERDDRYDSPRRGGYGRHSPYGRSPSPAYRRRPSPDYGRGRSPAYDRYNGPVYDQRRSPDHGRHRSPVPVYDRRRSPDYGRNRSPNFGRYRR
ncbi:hypothetical protein CUMW_091830 [Citrus unshiu]|nr:hypothetical protein CUMW_091830 [Citrus unshiu]